MNNTEDLISIVVPIFKVEKYLQRCIDSILSQTYKHYELILVDDGSPDNCPKICDDYANKNKNIFAIHKKNAGVSEARNAGIKMAKGKYLTFIDADDYVNENLLEVLKSTLDKNEVRLSMCSYKRVNDSNEEVKPIINKKSVRVINDLEAMDMLLEDQTTCVPWGKLYDIDLFDNISYPVGKIMEDMFITPLIFKKAKSIAISSQELYFYNQEGESITRSKFDYNKLNMVEATYFWKEHVDLCYPELSEKANIHYFTTVINNCIPLSKIKDSYGISKYNEYKEKVLNNYKFIIGSKYTTRNTKIKVIILKLGLFRLVLH